MYFNCKMQVKKYLAKTEFPVFKTIEIETINRCNGACSFCPVNKYNDPRPYKKMEKALFLSIINQLKEINYNGFIGMYSNNEPLLDDRLLSFLKIAKEEVPKAKLYLFTNGSTMTIEFLDELMKYLDWITIDNYNDNLVLNKSLKSIYNDILNKSYNNRVFIYLRKENEVLYNRSGEANNRTKNKFKCKSPCLYPFEQVVVRPDGKLSLCCNDAVGNETMGDLNIEKLSEIWRGAKYKIVRENMFKSRERNYLCKNCDNITAKVEIGTNFKIKNILKMIKLS